MKQIWAGLIGSLDTKPSNGFAARKLSALLCFALAAYLHVKYCTPENALNFLICDYIVALLLLAIITVQDVIKLKNGGNNSSSVSSET